MNHVSTSEGNSFIKKRLFKGPGTALFETEPFQVYTNENHS